MPVIVPMVKDGHHKVGKTQLKWWNLIDDVADEEVRGRLMRELAEGSEAKRVVVALKRAVYLCSPSFDIDAYLQGRSQAVELIGRLEGPSPQVKHWPDALGDTLRVLLSRFRDNDALATFDLEFDGRRVRQRTTKDTLVSAKELKVLEEAAISSSNAG